MKTPPKARFRFLELHEKSLSEALSEAEIAEFRELATSHPALLDLLAETLLTDATLRQDARLLRDLKNLGIAPPARQGRPALLALTLLSATLATLLALSHFGPEPESPSPPTIATLVKAADCRWAASSLPTTEGSKVGTGVFKLAEGLALIRFHNGAELTLEPPATLELAGPNHAILHSGTVVVQTTHASSDFRIESPLARITPGSSRFGFSTGKEQEFMVQTLTGEVTVTEKPTGETHHIAAGSTLDRGLLKKQLRPERSKQPEPTRWQPDGIVNEGGGWKVLSTNHGRGQDSFIESGRTQSKFGDEAFFRVKKTSVQPHLNRLGYLRFDLADFHGARFENAELTLSIEPSNLGYATNVPDSTFLIYGLRNEDGDDWREQEITFANAPARPPDETEPYLPDPAQVTLLGRFTIAQGVNRGLRSLRSPELTAFLNADTNRLVTFIIARETDESDRAGLVHAFATKENGNNTPPLLRLKPRQAPQP
ncbi:MAG: DNRLRE domain-containing protein [Verrucomicrobiales bacterium]